MNLNQTCPPESSEWVFIDTDYTGRTKSADPGRAGAGADMVIVGAQFDLLSADSSRPLPVAPAGAASCATADSYTVGPAPNAAAGVVEVKWAAGYARASIATNEWMDASVPRDLGYGHLALRLAPRAWAAAQLPSGVLAVVGGRTVLENERVWVWGTAVHGAKPVWVGQFLVRPPLANEADECSRKDAEAVESPACVRADVWLEFADPAVALGITQLTKFVTTEWTAPTAAPAPGEPLVVLPNVDEWQHHGQCDGFTDFTVWTSSTSARGAWS
ncbi:hypothetical protein H9P43_009177 [Blastocladiella emersonii ATCC 22665]|nr:hypothetical protein H9P43_009177 [Blastocladiella emersonii ATCC 22665]